MTSPTPSDDSPDDLAAPDRTLFNSRFVAVRPSAAFAAFSDPARLALWWGPNGFTNTIAHFDFRPGGLWRYTMHAPNGAAYLNESQFLAVEPDACIELLHLGPMHRFQLKMSYTPEAEGTRVTWRMRFDDAAHVAAIRDFLRGANDENLARLAAHLASFPE